MNNKYKDVKDSDKIKYLDTSLIELNDFDKDIISVHNLTYFYAYKFKEGVDKIKRKQFQEFLTYNLLYTNYSCSNEFFELVEDATLHFDSFKGIQHFKVPLSVVDPYAESDSNIGREANFCFTQLCLHLEEYAYSLITGLSNLKAEISKMIFDTKRALEIYSKHKPKMVKIINQISTDFNNTDPYKLSLIKKYSSKIYKEDFICYLKYEKEHQKELIENLIRGTDVLIIDDFILPETYLKETIRFINSVNPNNNITIFSFMKRF